ncbi:tubby C-terminal-like domain-containing protein [Lasiosphaeria miniovina]|uniref:Tubby C-terminal-like domain-containing protein n=1 Tax=Lasiosphaeria miniovina TaxID=1954250 RepID=A0AA40B3L6_9PEZI|nr:tubby C-terminal-like domain-containing protein [Lasiosphaeria miniovina]KAK0726893.1 tubby C-terminal-like domain-containing protein [Lasiosphaeria miniovina]
MALQLPPVPQPLGLNHPTADLLLARQTETIILREKVMSLSGDSFDISLQSGQPILRVQGSVFSFSGRKTVMNLNNQPVFDIKKEHLHIHATYAAVDPNGNPLLEVKSSFKLIGSKARATFVNKYTGQQESFLMQGNWFDSRADIVHEKTGMVVGNINRKLLSGRDILFGQQTYALTVAPGVDMSLMVAMCICMDEKNNEGKGGGILGLI